VGQAVPCAKSGPPIKLGQIGTFSGFIATSVGQARRALQVWANYQNEHGGVACHPIQLTQLDDQSDPTRANAAAKSLINDTKVVSLVGVFSPIAMSGVRDAVKGSNIPVVGGDGADPIWTTTPGIYDVGAAINSQIYLLNKAQAEAGRKKVAIFWCVEANSCTAGGAVAAGEGEYSAKAAGQEVVYKASISATQPDFTAQCQSAKNAGADNLFIATESTSLTRFMQSCDSLGYYPHITTCGICMGFDVNNKTLQKFKVTAATPVFPYMRTQSVAEQTFAAAFQKYSPGQPPDHISAQAWTAGMMFQRALELLGPEAQGQEITPAMVAKGLGLVKAETLGGLVAPTTYKPNQNHTAPNPCGSLLLFDKGTWRASSNRGFACMR
jgi:ABC-type branched-subunit amino acid transport system substrate-binding protein